MKIFFLLVFLFWNSELMAQHTVVSADRMNIFYIGVDNPVTIVAENCPCSKLIIKTTNGKLEGTGCEYLFRGTKPGPAVISVYKRSGNKLVKLGSNAFRLKNIPPPVFKIGPYGGSNTDNVNVVWLKEQEYVRGELENFDIDARFTIDSFTAKIVYVDSCRLKTIANKSNKISNELRDAFSFLRIGDIIVFDTIYAKGPDGGVWKLHPLILKVAKEK